MSDLLLIDGAMSAEESLQPAVGWRTEVAVPNLSGGNLALAGAVILHLFLLALILIAPRLGGEKEQPPVVYPVRLYNIAEVATVAVPIPAALPVPALAGVKGGSAPASPPISLPSPPVAAAPMALTAAPQSIAPLAAMATAPTLPAPLDVSEGAASPSAAEASTARAVAVSGAALKAQMESGVAGPALAAPPVALPVVLAQPLYRENPGPEYPPLARRRHLEGTVVLEVLVGVEGKVGGLAVHESSGHALLDEAALKAVKAWRFEPGRRGGAALAMPVLVPVRFGLR